MSYDAVNSDYSIDDMGVVTIRQGAIVVYNTVQQTSRKAVIESRMRQLEAELIELAKYGDDTYDDGAILVFDFQFNVQLVDSEIWYSYAALKNGNYWYLTGPQHGSKKTWDELVQFWNQGRLRSGLVHLATTYDRVIELEKVDD